MYAFLFHVHIASDAIWHDALRAVIMRRMWCVFRNMYGASRSVILLEGDKSTAEHGVVQGCSLIDVVL